MNIGRRPMRNKQLVMICKYMKNALKWREPIQHLLSPFQGSNLRVFPFHRALPDANAHKAFSLNYIYMLFIFNFLTENKSIFKQ